MSVKETKLLELEKRIEKLQSYIVNLEKYVQMDSRGISLRVGGSFLSLSGDDIFISSTRNLNLISGGSTQILSTDTMNILGESTTRIESSNHLNLKGSVINLN